MSKTVLTKGWSNPKGKCDMCGTKKATHWFGDTSVALCDEEYCASRNRAKYDAMLEEIEDDEQNRG
jgi:hypothetical protein